MTGEGKYPHTRFPVPEEWTKKDGGDKEYRKYTKASRIASNGHYYISLTILSFLTLYVGGPDQYSTAIYYTTLAPNDISLRLTKLQAECHQRV